MGKNGTQTLLIGGAAFLAWYFWSRANALKSLQFSPVGLGVQGGGVSLQIEVDNPTAAALFLNGFAGSLNIQGQPVGNVTDFQPQEILPGPNQISLYIQPNLFGIAAGVINQIDGREGSNTFQASLTGTANINDIPLPVNLSFT